MENVVLLKNNRWEVRSVVCGNEPCSECGKKAVLLQATGHLPHRGAIPRLDVKDFSHKAPLLSIPLALDSYGQAPLSLNQIMGKVPLMFDRDSDDSEKKRLAKQARCDICSTISALRLAHTELALAGGYDCESAKKISKDIEFLSTVIDHVNYQVNGVVSHQESWDLRTHEFKATHDFEVKQKGTWDTLKENWPWVDKVAALVLGGTMWITNSWKSIITLAQYGVQLLLPNNPVCQKDIDNLVWLAVNLSGIAFLYNVFSWLQNETNRRNKRLDHAYHKQLAGIIHEELTYRRQTRAAIKEKVLELYAQFGYYDELMHDFKRYAVLLDKDDLDKVDKIHRVRTKRIYATGIAGLFDKIFCRPFRGIDMAEESSSVIDHFNRLQANAEPSIPAVEPAKAASPSG